MDGSFTLISSNIRFDNPADGMLCWDMRKAFLTNTLKPHNASIIGTQEGRRSQLEEFAQLLSLKPSTQHRQWLDERMYPTLYTNTALDMKVLGSGDVWLSQTPQVPGSKLPESAYPRLCSWGRYDFQGKRLLVMNMHLDYAHASTRLQQAEILLAEMRAEIKTDDHIVLMGDFNERANASLHRYFLQELPGLYDPWQSLNKVEESSYHSFTEVELLGHRIDWILLDERLRCLDIFLDKTSRGHLRTSDHYPLVCRVSL